MSSSRKRICILGATGSIGESTLRVARDYPDQFEIVGLSAHGSATRLAEQAAEFGVGSVCLAGEAQAEFPTGTRVFREAKGLVELIDACAPEMVVVATVGYAGLMPTLRAIELGIPVALANKEVLVAAGDLVMTGARAKGVPILPIDSEHNAIFQCLAGRREGTPLRRIILTASGGPFRGRSRESLIGVTRAEALNHPTWKMGAKITIDSATLMNKGFEVIEVHHLFEAAMDSIEVVIHPQSVIHGMIEYCDGSMLAQLGVTDMYLPIANVLAYPERLVNTRFEPLCLPTLARMTFEKPDLDAFPCLRYAYESIQAGGTCPTVLNAANEIAVQRFLDGEIQFLEIAEMIDAALQAHERIDSPTLEEIAAADAATRAWCTARTTLSRA